MWSDEIFGWMLVTDMSLSHMFTAWRAGADGGGILFYLLARLWLGVFGHTVLVFRLFLAAGVATAAVFTFTTARRFVRWPLALFPVILLWFTSDNVLWQIMQARFYGLLLAGVACAAYLFVLIYEHQTPARVLLLLNFLCHTLLAGTHPFGVIYSAAITCASICVDLVKRRRPFRALSAIAGWWILVPSLQAMRSSAAVGKPHFWTTTPNLKALGDSYSCWSLVAAVALGASLGVVLLRLLTRGLRFEHLRANVVRHSAPTILCTALLLIPIAVWLASQFGTSVFVDRYLVPQVIATSFLLSQFLDWLVPAPTKEGSMLPSRLFLVAFVGLMVWASGIALLQYPRQAQLPSAVRTQD